MGQVNEVLSVSGSQYSDWKFHAQSVDLLLENPISTGGFVQEITGTLR